MLGASAPLAAPPARHHAVRGVRLGGHGGVHEALERPVDRIKALLDVAVGLAPVYTARALA